MIRVSDKTYHKLLKFADQRGITIQDAAEYFINESVGGMDRARLNIFEKLTHELAKASEDRSAEDYEADIRTGAFLDRYSELENNMMYLASFPCAKCGEPLNWFAGDQLAKSVQHYVAQEQWQHDDCDANAGYRKVMKPESLK